MIFCSTKGMVKRPGFREHFRLGPWTGWCLLSCKRFVVMTACHDSREVFIPKIKVSQGGR